MKLIFRYDDFSAGDLVAFETDRRVFELFIDCGVPLLVAATPRMSKSLRDPNNESFCDLERDPQRIALLRRGLDAGWQLAQHGYTHQMVDSVHATEFAGQPHAIQRAKIENGQTILRRCFPGTPLDVFVPPWNSFDDVTLRCAAELDFCFLSGHDNRTASSPGKIIYAPSLLETRGLLDYLRHYSLEDLIRVVGDGWLMVTLHGYDFDGSRPALLTSLEELGAVLRDIHSRRGLAGILTPNRAPIPVTPKQESILKGRIFLARRALGRFASESVASMAWRVKNGFRRR